MIKHFPSLLFYRDGTNPGDANADWREIIIVSEKRPPEAGAFTIQVLAGIGMKKKSGPRAARFSGSYADVERERNNVIEHLEREGFFIYDPSSPW